MSMLLMVKAMSCKIGNPARKLVLLKLADNANDDGECFPSYQYIADHCEISKRSAIEHIKRLEQDGYLEIEHRYTKNNNRSNVYKLNFDAKKLSTPSAESAPPPSAEFAPPSAESAPPPSAESAPITSHSFNQSLKRETRASDFVIPDKQTVDNFARDEQLNLDGYFDYRQRDGWQIINGTKKRPIENWQADARLWSTRQKTFKPASTKDEVVIRPLSERVMRPSSVSKAPITSPRKLSELLSEDNISITRRVTS